MKTLLFSFSPLLFLRVNVRHGFIAVVNNQFESSGLHQNDFREPVELATNTQELKSTTKRNKWQQTICTPNKRYLKRKQKD